MPRRQGSARAGRARRLNGRNRIARLGLALLVAGLCQQAGLAQESLAERSERVESMPPNEKQQLQRRLDRFEGLDPAEQNRLRQLNEDLEQAPDAPRLREVMQRYYEWLKTLTPYQRIELNQLPAEKRIERIKSLMQFQALRPPTPQETRRAEVIKKVLEQQAKKLRGELQEQDVGVLFDWLAEVSERRAPRFLERLPEPMNKNFEQQLETVKDPQRRRLLFTWLWMQWQATHPDQLPPLSDKDLAALRSRLSPAAREKLASKPAPEQWRIIGVWTSLLPQGKSPPRRADELFSEETERKLAMFFEHVLTNEEKDRLLAMPSDKMLRELWQEYTRAQVSKAPQRPAGQAGPGQGKRAGQRGKAGKGAQNPMSASGAKKTPEPQPSKQND